MANTDDSDKNGSGYQELRAALKAVKQHFVYASVFSSAANLLHLAPILYMLAIYDRVLTSGSKATLATLTVMLVFLLISMACFEWVRYYILVTVSNKLDLILRERVFSATIKRALSTPAGRNSVAPLNDLHGLRQFLTGNGLFGFFDLPWVPVYVCIMFLFYPLFGVAAVISVVIMLGLAYYTEITTSSKLRHAQIKSEQNSARVIGSLRNAEAIDAMGMFGAVSDKLNEQNDRILSLQSEANKQTGVLSAVSRGYRSIMQSLMLGLGAYLYIQQEVSGGMVIAGSLMLGRALAPIDLIVASWRGFAVASGRYEKLARILTAIPKERKRMKLPPPMGVLMVKDISVRSPSTYKTVLSGISFNIDSGEGLGVIGPSASGKTSLARAVLGIWPIYDGKVRLDGSDIRNWCRDDLGPHIGYLPQGIELFDGTIAENISRLGKGNPEKIIAAAQQAGVHEMILQQPDGYDTVIGASDGILSAGQRQRIGLARAIYGVPKLLVLDEPNSNLDEQGERELVGAIQRIKAAGCAVLIVSHRTSVLTSVDKLLFLRQGEQIAYGSRDQVLRDLNAMATEK